MEPSAGGGPDYNKGIIRMLEHFRHYQSRIIKLYICDDVTTQDSKVSDPPTLSRSVLFMQTLAT